MVGVRVTRDYHNDLVQVSMTVDEFRGYVEWFEMIAPHDGATRDWRECLDWLDPEDTVE